MAGRYNRTIRSAMVPRGPGMRDRIESAHDPRHALWRLLPYLNPFKWTLIAVCFLVAGYTVLGLLGPYLMGVELSSILLLAGLAGAYHLGKREP